MNKKRLLIFTVIICSLVIGAKNFDAADIITQDMDVCANVEYYLDVEGDNHQVLLLDENNTLIQSLSYNQGDYIYFPTNASTIKALIYNVDADGNDVFDKEVDFKVSDCGYEVVTDDYEYNSMMSDIQYADGVFTFTVNEDVSNYSLQIQELDKSSGKELPFDNNVATYEVEDPETTEYIHLKEIYKNEDGDDVTKYFEIDLTSDVVFVREVNSFELNILDRSSLINWKYIAIIILLLLMLFIVNILIKKTKKKIKNKKIRRMNQRRRRIRSGGVVIENEENNQ